MYEIKPYLKLNTAKIMVDESTGESVTVWTLKMKLSNGEYAYYSFNSEKEAIDFAENNKGKPLN